MDVLVGNTKKYNIPLSHFEQSYIINCTNGKELEKIYKVLKSGDEGKFPQLEALTLERIEKIKPNSSLLRDEKPPLNTSFLPEEELNNFNDFLNTMNRKQENGVPDTTSTIHYPIRSSTGMDNTIHNVGKQISKKNSALPRSYDEWGKLDKQLELDDDTDEDDKTSSKSPNGITKSDNISSVTSQHNDINEQHHTLAEELRIQGNTAYNQKMYQQAYDYYTNSLKYNKKNLSLHNNRAMAGLKLNKYDECIADCNEVLHADNRNIKGLYRRAQAFYGKKMYNEAITDLQKLLLYDSNNNEAKELLNIVTAKRDEYVGVQQRGGKRLEIVDDDNDILSEEIDTVGRKIEIKAVESEDDDEDDDDVAKVDRDGKIIQDIDNNITAPIVYSSNQQPCIELLADDDSTPSSYVTDRKNLFNNGSNLQTRYSSGDGVEADNEAEDDDNNSLDSDGLGENSRSPRSMNVSPITTPQDQIDQSILFSPVPDDDNNESFEDDIYNPKLLHTQQNEYDPNIYEDERETVPKTNPSMWNDTFTTVSSTDAPLDNDDFDDIDSGNDRSTILFTDAVSRSNFSLHIQHWLRETAYGANYLQSDEIKRFMTASTKPWSRQQIPWDLDKIDHHIRNFSRLGDFQSTIDASKKMLRNGFLDYHYHTEHIVEILWTCADSYAKLANDRCAIEFASEALQFNIIHGQSLMCRAKAFQNENFLLYAYSDYSKIPSNDPKYQLASSLRETVKTMLNEKEPTWREKLSGLTDDLFMLYIKEKHNCPSTTVEQYEWYRAYGNQLYNNACYVLATKFYDKCTEINKEKPTAYSNRGACYLKLYEPLKAISDFDIVLNHDNRNIRALYRKACAYKMLNNNNLYLSTLKEYLKINPTNQLVLTEYYKSQKMQVPRHLRRIRAAFKNPELDLQQQPQQLSSTVLMNGNTDTENFLTFNEIDSLRKEADNHVMSLYEFLQKINTTKPSDLKNYSKLLFHLKPATVNIQIGNISPKLLETILKYFYHFIRAEKQQQQQQQNNDTFSYSEYCFNILYELLSIQRFDMCLSMLEDSSKHYINELVAYFTSTTTTIDRKKLNELKKGFKVI